MLDEGWCEEVILLAEESVMEKENRLMHGIGSVRIMDLTPMMALQETSVML